MKNVLRIALLPIITLLILSACGAKPILDEVSVSPNVITPNADGDQDAAKITFSLNREATLSVTLYDQNGMKYIFRPPTRVTQKSRHTVYFRGVVEGYLNPDESPFPYEVTKRMLPDGAYTWQILAEAGQDERTEITGTLSIKNADTQLPGIQGFTIFPKAFSPNQDGVDDRARVNLVLEKDVEDLRVYLKGADGIEHHIPEDEKNTKPKAEGWHTFDYDGGIDAGNEPPVDGTYVIFAEARDAVGQRVIISDTLDIINAGLPRAYVANGEVTYSTATTILSETLCYTLTVENDSNTYIRTTGPWPGTTYHSDQNFNTLDWHEESGVFRIGMDFEDSLRNYPFRWGIGTPGENLEQIGRYWYLPPKERSVVTGCVQIVQVPIENPAYFWIGLIHEDVAIAPVNDRVDPHLVTVQEP